MKVFTHQPRERVKVRPALPPAVTRSLRIEHVAQEAAQQRRGPGHVRFHRAPGLLGVAGQDGPHDGGVLDVRVLEVAFQHRDGIEQVDQPDPGLDHAGGQQRGSRRVRDGQVQPAEFVVIQIQQLAGQLQV